MRFLNFVLAVKANTNDMYINTNDSPYISYYTLYPTQIDLRYLPQ